MGHTHTYTRKFSLADLIYAASGYRQHDQNQLVSQVVVEGHGTIEESDLKHAVETVSVSCPATRARLRGAWGFKHWSATGPLPHVRTIHQEWDGQYQNGLSFIDKPLDLIRGPVAEIIQVVGTKTFLVFRIHHAVTDGVGLMDFVHSIFLALNQLQPEPFYSKITVEKMPPGNIKAIPPKVSNAALPYPLNSEPQAPDRSRVWRRLSVAGKDHKILLKVILALAELARQDKQQTIRIHVPASLRRHVPNERSSANLVGMVKLDISPEDDCRTLVKKFNARLEEKQELPIAVNSLSSKLALWIPLCVLHKIEKFALSKLLAQPRFSCSGTASSLGKLKLKEYSTETFQAQSCYGIPIPPLGSPVMAVIMSSEASTEIVLSVNRTLISDSAMDTMSEKFHSLVMSLK